MMQRKLTGLLLLAAFAAPVGAATFVIGSDAALLDQAPVAAAVRVLAVEPSPAAGYPSTDHIVQVERLIKGHVAGSALVVRVVGGTTSDGSMLKVWGAPLLREGDRAILLLVPRDDGTYGILHLALGAFRQVDLGLRRLAVRDLVPDITGGVGRTGDRLRDFDALTAWMTDRAAGLNRVPDYFVTLSKPLAAGAAVPAGRSRGLRREEFDRGAAAEWWLQRGGYDGRGRGTAAFAASLELWSGLSGSRAAYALAGTLRAAELRSAWKAPDARNSVVFNDPLEVMPGSFRCGEDGGGVLSITGAWLDPLAPVSAGGGRYLRVLETDILTNDGAACALRSLAERVFAHELGHGLGIGDLPCGGAADSPCSGADVDVMSAVVAPGADVVRLGPGDRSAVLELYRRAER